LHRVLTRLGPYGKPRIRRDTRFAQHSHRVTTSFRAHPHAKGLKLHASLPQTPPMPTHRGPWGNVLSHRIAFLASDAPAGQTALATLTARYGNHSLARASLIVALGGDGFMLQTLHQTQSLDLPVYGMNCGTIGFLMNAYGEDDLPQRLDEAEETVVNPLTMRAETADGSVKHGLAINEISMLRAGPQAAKLRISVDGRVRMEELVCDGALVATPAGSTAYNYSAHGPIVPIGSDVLALTAIAAFRPRRWRGALLPRSAVVRFDVLEAEKRPVRADADSISVPNVLAVEIRSDDSIRHRILFDEGHGLEERLLREQFA
jgi:NAD+ kinase